MDLGFKVIAFFCDKGSHAVLRLCDFVVNMYYEMVLCCLDVVMECV